MSLTSEVIQVIEQRGSGTVDDILPDLPGYSRAQVLRALKHGAERDALVSDGIRVTPGIHGGTPTTYRPKSKAVRQRVCSAWDYAQRAVEA